MREEVTFKDHRISELEQAVLKEKEHVTKIEGEVQVCVCVCREGGGQVIVSVCVTVVNLPLQSLLDRMTVEVEKNMRLSSELQEGHSGKEVRLVAPL